MLTGPLCTMKMDQHIKQLIEKYTSEARRLPKNKALEKFKMAYKQAKELGNPFTVRACAANLGAIHVSLANPEAAEKGLQYLDEALPPDGKSDAASNGDLYFNKGLACEFLGRYREAGRHFERAWQEYKSERDNVTMEQDTLKRLVKVSQMRQKHAEAVNWFLKLEDTYGHADKTQERLLVMVKRITLQYEHKMEGTQDALDKCCDMLDSIRKSGQASVGLLVQVAVLMTQFQQLEKARQYLEEAKNTFEVEDGQTVDKAVVLQNLATVCNYMGDWETSIPYHRAAAQIYHHYAIMTPDPKAPLLPKAAKRLRGHVLANQAYACIQLDNVDEARLLFQEALRLAEESEDIDTKWQMEEALGAVHFRLAMDDIELPHTMTASMKVALPESRFEHMDKSIESYKAALSDLSLSPKGNTAILDRVLHKYSQVQTFRGNASKVQYHLSLPNAVPARAQVLLRKPEGSHEAGSDKKGSDEEGCEDPGSSGDDKRDEGDDDDDDDDYDSGTEEDKGKDEEEEEEDQLKVTQSMQGLPDENLKKYQQQLQNEQEEAQSDYDDEESMPQQRKQTVRAVVHSQKKQYSSSAESGSSSDEDSNSDDISSENEDKDKGNEKGTRIAGNRGPVPPVPTQSPPVTMKASGTYENPQTVHSEMHINPVYEGTVPAASNYAELDFARKKSKRGESHQAEDNRRMSLNFFISSSEEETERTAKQRDREPQEEGESSGYEPVGPGRSRNRSQERDSDVVDHPPLPENKKENSKYCVLM